MTSKIKGQIKTGVFLGLIVMAVVGLSRVVASQKTSSELDWPPITSQTRPWTRWWWLGNVINQKDLTIEMEKYRKAGLGGLEITPIYGVKGYENRFIDYLSPQWMEMFEHTLKEAKRLGMGVDLATGTGWPFGGRWIEADDACKNLTHKTYSLKAGESLSEPVVFIQKPLVRAIGRRLSISEIKDPLSANDNLQALALEQVRFEKPLPLQVLMAYSDRGKTLDLTAQVKPGGKLDWVAPEGDWTLYAVFQGWHGKLVERAGPGGEGNVIDHFSALALRNYLKKFDQAFAGRDLRLLRAFFNDSYEVDDGDGEATWTPGFFEEFARRRGYDLRRHLPALFSKDAAENNSRVLTDYRETISELLLENFTIGWQRWAAGKGAIIRNQSHGSPANLLDLYAASDIPETEGQDIVRMKFASSAANVTGKPLASAETATWLGEHFTSTLGDVKSAVDNYFLGGINHVCYHGTPFSPESEAWPGFLFYAAVHFGPTNSFWRDFPALNHYITRCQSFLQAGKPDNELLLYYPIHESWSQPGRSLLQHYGGGHDSAMSQVESKMLLDAGFSFDLISDRQLTEVQLTGNSLRTGGLAYQAIVLPAMKLMPLKTLDRLVALAKSGATIIVRGGLPLDVPGLGDLEARRKSFQGSIAQIKFAATGAPNAQVAQVGKGRFILSDDLGRGLSLAGVKRETLVDAGLKFIRRKHERGHHYFIVNQGKERFAGWIAIQAGAESAAIFDPMREEKGLAAFRSTGERGDEVYLQLEPGESRILKTFDRKIYAPAYTYFKSQGESQKIDGMWSIRFIAGGPELPAAREITSLGSWTELGGEEVKRFSGTALYSITFDKPAGGAGVWTLDLGRVAESASVRLNGRELGTMIKAPYRFYLPSTLFKDRNTLEVSVSNLMANRIADLDRRKVVWKKFYNTNFPSRQSENRGPDGLFSAARWTPFPSGLIGPVTLTPAEILKFDQK